MSKAALNNKMLILLINIGDQFTGVYLLNIAVMDTIVYESNYCTERLEWLTSAHCSLIGVISTVGYQISLVSMTNLGLARLAEIKNGSIISYRVNIEQACHPQYLPPGN